MKSKIIIIVMCVVIVGIGTFLGILKVGTCSSAATPQIEPSTDIGATFPPHEVQIKYASLAPVITRSEAIATAKNWLHDGFNFATDNLPAEATVVLYSGPIEPPNTRPTGVVASDVPAWIVVIKGFPPIGSVGPFDPNNPNFTVQVTSQANVAIDATTGKILYATISGKVQRFPAQ